MSQAQLAESVGVSMRTISCWEHGSKNPTLTYLVSLTKALEVSADDLLNSDETSTGFVNHLLSNAEYKLVMEFRKLDIYGKKTVETLCVLENSRVECEKCTKPRRSTYKSSKVMECNYRFIPKYSSPAAAGYAAPIEGDDYEMLLVDDSVPRSADYAVEIHGQSMMPHIHDGETVYVNRNSEVSIGDVGIFNVNGETYCKQYYIDGSGDLTLVSSNPSLKSSNVKIKADSSFAVRCYGKVMLGRKIPLPNYFTK